MTEWGLFTASDMSTIARATALAERLTQAYFGLAQDEWTNWPCGVFTLKQIDHELYREDTFAQVIRYRDSSPRSGDNRQPDAFGIVLQDPNILQALLRSTDHDLWTIGLFLLTHELIHIVRFRRFNVDFFASESDRDREEELVQEMTREILSGVSNTDLILSLYGPNFDRIDQVIRPDEGVLNAHIRVPVRELRC